VTFLLHKSHIDPSCVIGAKENLGPFLVLRPKVLVPNFCHIDRHVGWEVIRVGPQCKAFGSNLTIMSNPIGRNLDNLNWHLPCI
jgi:hypothetical protein